MSSTQSVAMLEIDSSEYLLWVNNSRQLKGSVHELTVSDRTGNIQRRITLPDNSVFETENNDAIDDFLSHTDHHSNHRSVLHRLESSWGWVIVGMIFLFITPLVFFKWGLPTVSKKIAYSLPASVHETVTAGTLTILDRLLLDPSELSLENRLVIQAKFDEILSHIDNDGFTFKLHFRKMGVPNAFALPSGDIIVTDELFEISKPIEELIAVLFHEVGHVLERHGLQQVIQASAITVIASLAIGDLSGIGELATSMPIFLMQSSYSRKAESSADLFALKGMAEQGIDPIHFATIMTKFAEYIGEEDEDDNASYFSSHPNTLIRAEKARAYSEKHFSKP